jgi:Predicted permeases
MNNKLIKAHLALFAAGCMWGLMAPVGKAAMDAGITGLSLASMRMIGAAICFWIASFFAPKEKVSRRDLLLLFFAGMLCIVFNLGLFTIGLSLTSPVDSTIITTSTPILTMLLAALFLKEPITLVKVAGVILGAVGALMLILSNNEGSDVSGSILGDVICLIAQISFALYLTVFKGLISRYNVFTLMKWMFTYSAICITLYSFRDLSDTASLSFPVNVWLQVGYVVFFGTFVSYILVLVGQKALRPTIVSSYNYIQPVVATIVAVYLGMGTFGWLKAFASVLIFAGVYVVTQSKSREQMLKERK